MGIIHEWEQCFSNDKSIYDFISSCLSVLDKYIVGKSARLIFVEEVNDNHNVYKTVRETIEKEYSTLFTDREKIEYIKHIVSSYSRTKDCEQLAIMYSILLGINTALKSRADKTFKIWGPLDYNDDNVYRVYLRPYTTYLDSFIAGVGKDRCIDKDCLLASLDRFIFVKSSELLLNPGDTFPKGILVDIKEDNWNQWKMRIGISPLNCKKNFDFKPTKTADPNTQFFTVEYPPSIDQSSFADNVEKALDKAIDYKCNIVVFPEYTCSKQIKTAISDYLKAASSKGGFVPDLVFAGTTWNHNNENELLVFDREGFEIGQYHKRIGFDNKIEGIRWVENLKNEWSNNTFFCLPGIGYIMPVICRDALVNNGPSDLFSILFSPLLIVIPAWSPSINSFTRVGNNIIDSFASYIVADACSAVFDKKDHIRGKGYIVTKDGTIVGGQPIDLINNTCNGSNCQNGCLLVVDYDFEYISGKKESDKPIKPTSIKQV